MPDPQHPAGMTGPPLGEVIPNIAMLIERNAWRYPHVAVFREKRAGAFAGPEWTEFAATVRTIAWRLHEHGFRRGDVCAIVSPNRLEMLLFELAVMAAGGAAAPIFAFYPQEPLERRIDFCDARFLAVGGKTQLERITHTGKIKRIFTFDDVAPFARFPMLTPFGALRRGAPEAGFALATDADPDGVCLMQFTSGTTGAMKCVQLTHRNILSQQAALDQVWALGEGDRLLPYLPWHHSFGGIFELFSALYRGATMSLEPSYGKDPVSIMENWREVRPTAFFSVPKVYQSLVDLARGNRELQDALFHPELKFIFTAAAPLPEPVAKEFEERGVRIVEGWGLTETSPCCTITGADGTRRHGVVGKPLPGVRLRLGKEGEIQVRGPNVMPGYYKNDDANAQAFTADGWFRTGDIGAIADGGLRLIGRRDRIFKLSNGEKVVSADVEQALLGACHYLSYAFVEGSGQSYPVALLFPNRQLLASGGKGLNDCACPRSLADLSVCLRTCLAEANAGIVQKFARPPYVVLVDGDLSIENGTLTPSMKVVAKNVNAMYKGTIEALYGGGAQSENVFIIPLRSDQPHA